MQGNIFQRCTHLLHCSVLSLGGNVAWHGIHLSHKKINEIFWSKEIIMWIKCFYPPRILDKHLQMHLFFCPERTGLYLCAEYTQLQLTFLALYPWLWSKMWKIVFLTRKCLFVWVSPLFLISKKMPKSLLQRNRNYK